MKKPRLTIAKSPLRDDQLALIPKHWLRPGDDRKFRIKPWSPEEPIESRGICTVLRAWLAAGIVRAEQQLPSDRTRRLQTTDAEWFARVEELERDESLSQEGAIARFAAEMKKNKSVKVKPSPRSIRRAINREQRLRRILEDHDLAIQAIRTLHEMGGPNEPTREKSGPT